MFNLDYESYILDSRAIQKDTIFKSILALLMNNEQQKSKAIG